MCSNWKHTNDGRATGSPRTARWRPGSGARRRSCAARLGFSGARVSRTPFASGNGFVAEFGLGGIFVEALEDVTFRAAPIDGSQARAMIESVAACPLLTGLRGRPPPDLAPLAAALSRLSLFAAANAAAIGMTCPWRLVRFPGSRSRAALSRIEFISCVR